MKSTGSKGVGAPERIAQSVQNQSLALETASSETHHESMACKADWKPARNPGGIDAWGYPEDVPSDHMAQHPRRTVGRIALACCIVGVIALWAGVALSQTHDSAGRYILRGDPSARPSPHHSGGGITTSAARYFLRIADRGPFRIEGDWFSSGTMVLALVVGPDAVESSCLGNVRFSFHEGIPLRGGNSNLNQNRTYSGVFTRQLRDWYHTMRNGRGMNYFAEMHLTQTDLSQMGYPVCEDVQ